MSIKSYQGDAISEWEKKPDLNNKIRQASQLVGGQFLCSTPRHEVLQLDFYEFIPSTNDSEKGSDKNFPAARSNKEDVYAGNA